MAELKQLSSEDFRLRRCTTFAKTTPINLPRHLQDRVSPASRLHGDWIKIEDGISTLWWKDGQHRVTLTAEGFLWEIAPTPPQRGG